MIKVKRISWVTYGSVAPNLLQPTPVGPGLLSNQVATTAITTVKSTDLGFGNALPDLNNVDYIAVIKKLYPGYNSSDKKFIANKISAEANKRSEEDAIKYIVEKVEEVYALDKSLAFNTFLFIEPPRLMGKSLNLLAPETKKFMLRESMRVKEEYLKKNPNR